MLKLKMMFRIGVTEGNLVTQQQISNPVPFQKNATMKVDQAEFERRFKMAKEVSSRQSDRDVPKTQLNHCVTCLTLLTGQELPGLVMLTMVCLDGMLPSRNMPNQNLIKRFSHLLWMTLSLNVCLNKPEKQQVKLMI
jgi:hypothetical protein